MVKIFPAIMSGGAGTRLWPVSTPATPKQFHALAGDDTMIQATATRFRNPPAPLEMLPPIVIGNVRHADLIESQLAEVGITPAALILEPMGRNTAATALLAADAAADMDPEALVLLLPADHRIRNPDAFLTAIARAAPHARDRIVTFGIEPTGPETGYGYIQRGDQLDAGVFAIQRFREKPELALAETLWRDGQHAWNAGIFLFHPDHLQAEFQRAPDIRDAVRSASSKSVREGIRRTLPEDLFARVPSQPFDIAIMEKTNRSAVTPCDIGWADVGSWAEIWRLAPLDASGNAVQGAAVALDCRNILVMGTGAPVAVCGLENVVVVSTPDGVLVLPRDRAQDVKALLEKLKTGGLA